MPKIKKTPIKGNEMKKLAVVASVVVLILTGCGGSSSDNSNSGGGSNGGGENGGGELKTGYFLDSAVQGISFETASKSGITDFKGAFPYNEGEKVTFSIGDLTFPTATASQYMTPLELAGTDNSSDPQVVNMVRLLMTLDTDGNPDNGISISAQAKEVATPVDFDVPVEQFAASQEVLDLVANGGQDTPTTGLVSESDAQQHFQKTLDDIDAFDTYADFVGMFNLEADDPNYDDSYTSIMNIYPDGSYLMIEYYSEDEDESGIEYGYLGLEKGSFDLDVKVDTDPSIEAGLSSGDWTNVFMDGETLHLTKTELHCEEEVPEDCTYEMTTPRVKIPGNTIVGSWETQDGNASYNFRADGKYFFAQVKDSNAALNEGDIGMEVGDYDFDSASQTLTLNLFLNSDTSGPTLLADNGTNYDIHSAVLSDDGQTLTLMVDYNDNKDTQLVLHRVL